MSVKFFIIPSYIWNVSQIPRRGPSMSLSSLLTANKSRLRCMMQEDILCKVLWKSFRRKTRWQWSWYDGMNKRCCYTVSGLRRIRYSRIGSSWEKPKIKWAGDGAQHLVLFWLELVNFRVWGSYSRDLCPAFVRSPRTASQHLRLYLSPSNLFLISFCLVTGTRRRWSFSFYHKYTYI